MADIAARLLDADDVCDASVTGSAKWKPLPSTNSVTADGYRRTPFYEDRERVGAWNEMLLDGEVGLAVCFNGVDDSGFLIVLAKL